MAMTGLSRLAPLPLRLAAGAALCHHGFQKLYVHEFKNWVSMVETFGLPNTDLMAQIMAWGEMAGGALLILGFVTRLSALLNAATLFIVIWKTNLGDDIWGNLQDRFAGAGGYEFSMVLMAACLALLLSGAGTLSVDGLLVGRRSASNGSAEPD